MWKYFCSPVIMGFLYLNILVFPSICWSSGRYLILITHWHQNQRAALIKKRLIDVIGIPANAIDVIEQFKPCEKHFDALYFFCVVDGEDLFKVVSSQQSLFRETFGHLLQTHLDTNTETP